MAVFAEQIFTDNIFVSLVDGQSLQVLMFSILLGIALGVGDREKNRHALLTIEALFESLLKIINWLVYLLPLALFAMLAGQMSEINLITMLAMLKLVLAYAAVGMIMLVLGNGLMSWRTGRGFWQTLSGIKEALFVAGGTANAFAALPSALHGLNHNLGFERRITALVTPLALNLMPLATIAYFALCSLFVAQISGIDLSFAEYFLLFFGAILAGLAAASLPSAAGIAVIAVVLEPLGLPVAVAVILLVAIDPLMEPINAAVDTQMACTATSLIAPVEKPASS
jgi:Na+/H+-dicarboxylate symporter